MSAKKLQTIRLLSGIALLNKERANGYKKLLALLSNNPAQKVYGNVNLEILFHNFVSDSTLFSRILENIVLIEAGKMPYTTTIDQQLFQKATALKELFATANNFNIASVCDACEILLLSSYAWVLESNTMPADPKNMLLKQHTELQKSKPLVQQLKDGVNKGSGQASIIPIAIRDNASQLQAKVVG